MRGRVGGHDATNFSHLSKDAQENSTSFDTNVVLGRSGAKMVFNENPTKNRKLRVDLLSRNSTYKLSISNIQSKINL